MTMLDRMRRHKGWLKWSLALVVLTFVVFYIPDFLQPQTTATAGASPGEVIAEVGGREVTVADFQSAYQSQLQAYRNQFGEGINDSLLRQLGVEQQVLRQLIEEHLATIEAERQGIRVTDDELAEQIMSFPVFQEGGQFIGDARYREFLQAQNPPLTVAQFEEGLRRSLMNDRLRTALTDWMAISDAELEREYKTRNEKVKLQVVALTANTFRDKVSVSDAEVAAHFEANKEEYRVGEQRKVKYLLLDLDQARQRVSVTPNEIQRDYNQNIQQYQTPEQIRASHILLKTEGKSEDAVRKQAEEILKQVKAGGDFEALAKKYSEDEPSKEQGGDLDYRTRGSLVPEFETAAYALKPGEVSDLVKSSFGFHIIKLVDRRPEVTRPLEEVRQEIQERLLTQKASQQVADRATELANRIKSAGDLDKVGIEIGSKVQFSQLFTRDSPIPGLGVSPQAADAAFGLPDNNAVVGPIPTQRGPVFMALSDRKDPYVPMLDEVKERVKEDLIRSRAADLSRQRGQEIAASLTGARDFTAAAKALGLEAKETALIPRASPLPDVGASAEVDKVAFSLPVGGVGGPIATSDATVIVKVVERDEATPEEFRKARETFRAEMLNERRQKFYNAYMTRVKDQTTIRTNDDVLRRYMAARALKRARVIRQRSRIAGISASGSPAR
jgi:peptidyl-prolyl cis-trans isomerase D